MKATMALVAAALLLVALGIWLVWPQEQEIEVLAQEAEAEEEAAQAEVPETPGTAETETRTEAGLKEPRPSPVAVSRQETAPATAKPAPAPDRAEMVRAVEEAADNRQALKDWDRKLLLECRKFINEKKFEEAHQCLQLRLARNPDEPEIYLERGILHAHMGKLTEAYWDYTKFLELAPDSRDAPRIRAILEKMEASSE